MAVAFGTDAGVYPHGQNACQFPLLLELGLTPAPDLTAVNGIRWGICRCCNTWPS
jgi:imidazolonepropionase-like amidohydrolase